MKKLLMTAAMGVALAACASEPVNTLVCDREAIAWDKWGDPTEMAENCLPPVVNITSIVQAPVSGDNGDTLPTPTDEGTTPPDEEEDGSDTRSDDDVGSGNPGNDKDVGRSGEKEAKGMDEDDGSGSRGNSTRRGE